MDGAFLIGPRRDRPNRAAREGGGRDLMARLCGLAGRRAIGRGADLPCAKSRSSGDGGGRRKRKGPHSKAGPESGGRRTREEDTSICRWTLPREEDTAPSSIAMRGTEGGGTAGVSATRRIWRCLTFTATGAATCQPCVFRTPEGPGCGGAKEKAPLWERGRKVGQSAWEEDTPSAVNLAPWEEDMARVRGLATGAKGGGDGGCRSD